MNKIHAQSMHDPWTYPGALHEEGITTWKVIHIMQSRLHNAFVMQVNEASHVK